MTCLAFLRRWFVEEHCICGDKFRQLVAIAAAHILVRPSQREFRSPFMVEERRFPLHAVMALDAARTALQASWRSTAAAKGNFLSNDQTDLSSLPIAA